MKSIFDERHIEESNFLDYDVRKLRKAFDSTAFQTAIDRLDRIRSVLIIANKAERLQAIGNRAYYIEALRWLKGEVNIGTWHAVPQITDLQSITDDVANAFDIFTQQLQQNLQSEQVYSQIELAMLTAPEVKSQPISKRVQRAVDQAESKFGTASEIKIGEVNSLVDKANQDVQNIISSSRNTFTQDMEQAKQNAYQEINNQMRRAGSQLKAAVALDDWGKHYDADINRLEQRLHGKKFNGIILRNIQSISRKFSGLRSVGVKNIKWWKLIRRIMFILIKNILSAINILWSKISSLAARRTYAFFALVIVAGAMVIIPILSIFGYIQSSLFDTSDPVQWLSKLALWLPAVVIFSIGYSFTTKNYRIYANMLDQYFHRRAVAKTAQGIILGVESSEANKEFRSAMTSAAAVALFEHKVTGHLSKKEVESLGLLDVLKSVR